MVVLTPTGQLFERRGECPACGSIGLRSQIPERSHFERGGVGANLRYAPYCRECKAHPERVEEYENALIDAWEEREANGEALPFRPQSKRLQIGAALPIIPYRAWLRALIREESEGHPQNPHMVVARRLGVSSRRITEWLYDRDEIDEATVDRVATRDGTTVLEIYRCYADVDKRETRVERVCANPDCVHPRTVGRFCGPCSARLAAIRAEFKGESKAMAEMGGATRAESRRNPNRPKVGVCCNPNCWQPREIGERFCDECVDAGWVEEGAFQ